MITHRPVKWLSLFQCFIPSTTFFFKRKIIDSGIFVDNQFHITMDKEFFAHILDEGYKLKYIDDFFAHFRWHENNKSIDSDDVKEIRLNEGFKIYRRYNHLSNIIPNIKVYNLVSTLSSLYRRYLKIIS